MTSQTDLQMHNVPYLSSVCLMSVLNFVVGASFICGGSRSIMWRSDIVEARRCPSHTEQGESKRVQIAKVQTFQLCYGWIALDLNKQSAHYCGRFPSFRQHRFCTYTKNMELSYYDNPSLCSFSIRVQFANSLCLWLTLVLICIWPCVSFLGFVLFSCEIF